MFRVLYAPFEGEARCEIERYSQKAHSALVWEGGKKVKLFTANISAFPGERARIDSRLETACECLNVWKSLELIKEMLRAIYYTNEMGEQIRTEEKRQHLRPKPFFPSFRGHGGSGVDGYW